MAPNDASGTDAARVAATPAEALAVFTFWCEAGPKRWFKTDAAFDAEFRARFLDLHEAAARGALDRWGATAEGALALVLLLDQFPRNCFRDSPRTFATDARARAVADRAIAAGHDRAVSDALALFFYLPLMHSEHLADQDRSVALCSRLGDAKHAKKHREIVVRFGRFPHRNAVLGRESTPEEREHLERGGYLS
jgi:uncharacterized protein (DUF924 family)